MAELGHTVATAWRIHESVLWSTGLTGFTLPRITSGSTLEERADPAV